MAQRKRYLKLAAFIPAIILVGAFIGCRSGAFERLTKPEPPPEPHPLGLNMPPSLTTPQPPTPQPTPNAKPVFFSGAKSPNLPSITVGLTPAGTFTPDLDVPTRESKPNTPKP